jgi:hypothetical protein
VGVLHALPARSLARAVHLYLCIARHRRTSNPLFARACQVPGAPSTVSLLTNPLPALLTLTGQLVNFVMVPTEYQVGAGLRA